METEKEIIIDGQKYVIRKLTFGQVNKLSNLSMNSTPEHPRNDEIARTIVMFGLKSAPFPITAENIDNLPAHVGLQLIREINEFNGELDVVKKTNSEMYGNTALDTMPGQQNSQSNSSS